MIQTVWNIVSVLVFVLILGAVLKPLLWRMLNIGGKAADKQMDDLEDKI